MMPRGFGLFGKGCKMELLLLIPLMCLLFDGDEWDSDLLLLMLVLFLLVGWGGMGMDRY